MDILKKHSCSYCKKEILGAENYANHIIEMHKQEFDTFINTLSYGNFKYRKLAYANIETKKKVLLELLKTYERSL